MRSRAPDPYARTRAFWPMLRLFARWVIWQHRALATSGLLRGRAARWLSGQLELVEHGLRCLLVIGAQKLRASPNPDLSSPRSPSPHQAAPPLLSSRFGGEAGETGTHFSLVAERGGVGPRICAATPLGGDDKGGRAPPFERPDLDAISRPLARISHGSEAPWISAFAGDAAERGRAEQRARAFSLSLAAFNLPPNPKPVIPDAQRLGIQLPKAQQARSVDGSSDGLSPVGGDAPSHSAHPGEGRDLVQKARIVSEDPGLRRDERVNARADEQAGLASRLAAIFDVLANPEHHIARMARHLARRGIRLKRRPTTRPSAGAARGADRRRISAAAQRPLLAAPGAITSRAAPFDTS